MVAFIAGSDIVWKPFGFSTIIYKRLTAFYNQVDLFFFFFQFSPLIQDTVLRGTFNATLNNPIAPRLDNLGGVSAANHPFLLGV